MSIKDFRGLQDLKDGIGAKNVGGILFYKGEKIIPFSENFLAVPIRCLQ